MRSDIYSVVNGKVTLNLHPGQTAAWDSDRRFIFVIAGTQGGKTSFGPWWLWREIQNCGMGDYLAVTATYDLFKLKMLPELRRVFEIILGGWTYQASDRVIYSADTISRPGAPTAAQTRIILRAASSDGGLESATAKAAWIDEFGQDGFTLDAYEATLRRLSLAMGRLLGTTTPYNLGWPKTECYDRWAAGDGDMHVIQFTSLMNPNFPPAEYARAERTMQPWKFAMMYKAEFARPAGMVYDCFDNAVHKIAPFTIPDHWPRYGGLDFGGVHTAAVLVVKDPDSGCYYVIREYLEGGRSAKEHADELKAWGCRLWVGGSASEGQWRLEFAKAGLPIREPEITAVDVGIDRVYASHKEHKLFAFDTLAHYHDEKGRYAYKLDKSGKPTDEIKDKHDFHVMDAERYIIGFLRSDLQPLPDGQPTQRSKWKAEGLPDDVGAGRWRKY